MSNVVLQGIALEFGKCVSNGKGIYYFKPNCFDDVSDSGIRLLINHEGKSLGTTFDRLEVHVGDDALAFRYSIPDSWSAEFSKLADDFDTYVPISIGFSSTEYETIQIDGTQVKVISQGTLNEISVLDKDPATKCSYARVVSVDTCGTLEEDYGRIKLIGRYVSLHRKQRASENGCAVKYNHTSTDYDRAAGRFARALNALQ